MTEHGHQPRVVVQLANGQEVPTSPGGGQYLHSDEDRIDSVAQLAAMSNVDFEEAVMDDLAMSSPPPCGDPSAQHMIVSPAGQLDDDVDVTGDRHTLPHSGGPGRRPAGSSSGRGATVHPPTSPSPPPSMTPPDHYGGHVVQHQKGPRRAQVVTTPGGTAVQQQQPPTPGMVADHCYGLPYQDHNYGGATAAGAGGAPATGNGSTTSSSAVRLSSGTQPPVRTAGMRTSRSSISEENQEPFPIIGGLASYLGEDDSDDQGGLGSTATSTPLLSGSSRTLGGRSVGGDSLSISAYHRGGSVRDQGPGVPYYQRYVSSHHADSATFGHQYASPSYSQSLVTIGGRTYIRQVAAPTSTVGGYRSAGRDYLGISSPNQSIYNISGSPYGAARRVVPGGVTGVTTFKRAGRPRTRGGVQTHTTLVPALPHGSMLGDGSPAPIIAPSRGGRPSGRGRAARTDVSSSDSGGGQTGARRSRGAPAGGAATPTSPQMSLTQRRETKNAAAVLAEENRKAEEAEELTTERLTNSSKQDIVNEVQKKYQKLLETPLPTAKNSKQRKSGKATSVSPSKQLIDVENDRPERTPSPITSVIMAARADAERRKSRDAADMVVESIVRSPIRGPPASQPTTNSRKRQASPDFSLFEDPCLKEERDRDRALAEAAAREQARKLMAASPLVGIPTSPGPVVRSPVGHSHLQDVYPRPVDFIKVDDAANTPQAAEDAADDTSDASSTSDEEETAESWESSSSGSDVDNHWSGDYVTRCLCGMQHNDEFMISCDQCEVWQHCRCMGIDTKRVPDNYLCEKCKPRPLKLTPAQAKELQGKKLAKWAKDKERRKQQRAKRHEVRNKEREKRKIMRKSAKKGAMVGKQTSDEYSEIPENEYTSDAKRFVQMQGDSSGQGMLEQLSEQLCQVMYVAPGVQGLVSVHLVPPNQPVAEYRGRVCLKAECNGRDKAGRIQSHCLLYSGFTTGSSSTDAVLCIDARQKGSSARFARRSCRPNTQVKHLIRDEQLHLLLISTELIERGTEVTIPFDYDFRSSKFPLECACGATAEKEGENEEEDDVCPINELNRNLKVKKAQIVRSRTQARKDKQKQMADAKADQSRRAKEAQLRKAANKNSTAVKRAAQKVKAKLAVKSRKVKSKQQAAVAAAAAKRRVGGLKLKSKRLSSRTTSTGSVKDEKPAVEPKGKTPQKQQASPASPPPTKRVSAVMKRGTSRSRTRSLATDSGSDAKSPKPAALAAKKEEPLEPMDYTLPEDRNKPVLQSREERKLQMAVAQIAKLEENAKRKAENKQRRMSGDQAMSPPSSTSNKKTIMSPLRRGRMTKKPTVVHRRKNVNKWKRGQTNKVKGVPKAKRKAGTPTSSPGKRGSKDDVKVITSDEESDLSSGEESDDEGEEEEKSTGGGQMPTVDSSASRAPPRKRWGSSTVQSPGSPPSVGVSTRSGGSPAVSGVSTLSPAGGGKKRWLRQAMSEESVADEPSSSPPKKRRPGFDGSTEPFDRQPMDSMTPDEAAQLLTQMAADPQTPASPPPGGQQFSSPTRLIPTVAVDFGGIVAPTVIPPASGDRASLLSSGAQDAEVQPAKRERRKVTLDEYKKRKGPPRDAKKSGDEGSKLSDLDSPIASGPSSRPTTSFIPTLSEAELLESGRSHRLSSLPDPNQIGKTTVSVDDLKRRIYGKQFASANVPAGPLASSASSMETAQSDQQHSLPPPPPPPKKTEDLQRMSLADRLRTEFGLDDPSSEAPMPPPPPPPPPPPTGVVVVDSLPGWSNGPSGAGAASSQPSAPGYQTRSSRRW